MTWHPRDQHTCKFLPCLGQLRHFTKHKVTNRRFSLTEVRLIDKAWLGRSSCHSALWLESL